MWTKIILIFITAIITGAITIIASYIASRHAGKLNYQYSTKLFKLQFQNNVYHKLIWLLQKWIWSPKNEPIKFDNEIEYLEISHQLAPEITAELNKFFDIFNQIVNHKRHGEQYPERYPFIGDTELIKIRIEIEKLVVEKLRDLEE